jgi:hypothetical protein
MRDLPSTLREVDGVRGYRWWRVGLGGWLLSPWRNARPWRPEPQRARCLATRRLFGWREDRHAAHAAPHVRCSCGFYGLHRYPVTSPGPARFVWDVDTSYSGSGGMVLGVAEASGRVLVGTRGWRAEYARPSALYVAPWAFPSADVDAVRDRYDVAVYREFDALRAEWGPDDELPRELAG